MDSPVFMKINLNNRVTFKERHNSTLKYEEGEMVKEIGVSSVEQLIEETIPKRIRKETP